MITISLCMIVKNEEETLGRCLESVHGIPDEIIIVDTGSADATKEIAAKFGAKVVDFAWIDDFAAARNFSFAQATQEYIMWLDADDYLLTEDRAKFLELKASLHPNIDSVSMNYHTSFDANNNVNSSTRRLRLVRRSKNFTWSGVVHEDLEAKDTYTYLDSDVTITHGKPEGKSKGSTRNLEIFERNFAKGLEPAPGDLFNYARELEMTKDFAKAIEYYHKFLNTSDVKLDIALLALNNLATCYYMVGDLAKEWECTLKSLELDVPRPEFSCRIGERFVARNQFRQAAFWYELALQDPAQQPNAWTTENYAFKTWLPHKQLGLCYFHLGDYQRSLQHNEAAHQYLPNDPEIATNTAMLRNLVKENAAKG